jgi:hypothetical protein
LVGDFGDDGQCGFDGRVQVVSVGVFGVDGRERVDVDALVAVVYSGLEIAHKCAQKCSQFRRVKRVQDSLDNNLRDINVNFTGDSSLQRQRIFLDKVEIVQELDHAIKRPQQSQVILVDSFRSLHHQISCCKSFLILRLMLVFQLAAVAVRFLILIQIQFLFLKQLWR